MMFEILSMKFSSRPLWYLDHFLVYIAWSSSLDTLRNNEAASVGYIGG